METLKIITTTKFLDEIYSDDTNIEKININKENFIVYKLEKEDIFKSNHKCKNSYSNDEDEEKKKH